MYMELLSDLILRGYAWTVSQNAQKCSDLHICLNLCFVSILAINADSGDPLSKMTTAIFRYVTLITEDVDDLLTFFHIDFLDH